MVDYFQDRVFNTCLGFVKNRMEAEDVAQEVFMEAYSSVNHFREEASFSTWIYRIAITKSLDYIRRKHRKKRFAFFQQNDGGNDIRYSISHTETNHPLSQLEDKERAEVIYRAMKKLPQSQRVAITLHKIEGLSYKEISKIMDTSISSVESLIHRAKMKLKKLLYDYYKRTL
ncbi:MAG: sigma-70 family RNA polymerase sigma factor [Ignavibacteriales bacterium]|nr:sigma-70 family RNA polymerase sigma factor [Ignavibacteriales bacterium]